jgi:DNA-binding transcriptional MerR regulator
MARSRAAAKSDTAFRTISEVSDHLQVPQHVLRFWETKFDQLQPMKRGGGRRYYRPEDIELLRQIRDCLYAEGYTIKGVQKLLREGQIAASSGTGRASGRSGSGGARTQSAKAVAAEGAPGPAEAAADTIAPPSPQAGGASGIGETRAPASGAPTAPADVRLGHADRAALEAVLRDLEAAREDLKARTPPRRIKK